MKELVILVWKRTTKRQTRTEKAPQGERKGGREGNKPKKKTCTSHLRNVV